MALRVLQRRHRAGPDCHAGQPLLGKSHYRLLPDGHQFIKNKIRRYERSRGAFQELDCFAMVGIVRVGVGVKKAGVHKNTAQDITTCRGSRLNFRWSGP